MEDLIAHYGLIAIALGSGIEGEPFALAGGVLAHRHWLPPYAAVLAAILGSFMVDQMWFLLSRNFRQSRAVQAVIHRPAFRRSLALIERNPARFVLMFRFAYGLRAVTAVAVGCSRMPLRRFLPINLLAATLWGSIFTTLGYALGPALEQAVAHVGYALTALSIAVSGLVIFLLIRRRHS